jgi:hypothetical protein
MESMASLAKLEKDRPVMVDQRRRWRELITISAESNLNIGEPVNSGRVSDSREELWRSPHPVRREREKLMLHRVNDMSSCELFCGKVDEAREASATTEERERYN